MSWNRYTESAKNAVLIAQNEAHRLGEAHISTEHLLLGVVRQTPCVATRALKRMGFSCKELETKVRAVLVSLSIPLNQEMQLTLKAKTVLSHAYAEALKMGDNFIDTEHILLGLLLEGVDSRPALNRLMNSPKWQAGIAAQILKSEGVEFEATCKMIATLRGSHLLRASNMPDNSEELVRPAQENRIDSPNELLRSSEIENEQVEG